MNNTLLSTSGPLTCHSVRLRRGDDLLLSIKDIARQKHIRSGVVLSAVGCISKGRVRDASGVTIRDITDHCEIVSLNGTVGGHLTPGCIINTTCELVIAELPGVCFGVEEDPETGYDELIFQKA